MKTRSSLVSNYSKLIIGIAGLSLIIIGNSFTYKILKIDIDSLIVNIGALLFVIGILQWIFDEGLRKEIVQEISIATLSTDRIFRNGIKDCTSNSKKIEEENIWNSTSELIIGVHYSNRFFDDYCKVIHHRIKNEKTTEIFHIEENSKAAEYLDSSNSGRSNIGEKTKNMLDLIKFEFNSSQYIKVYKHQRVLRYSFIKTDQTIWVKFFTNSEGYSIVPAIKVETGSSFYDFFNDDIMRLKEQSDEFIK